MESSIKYVQSEGWRSGPAKSVLARMGEGGSAVSVSTSVFSKVRYKTEMK